MKCWFDRCDRSVTRYFVLKSRSPISVCEECSSYCLKAAVKYTEISKDQYLLALLKEKL